MEDDIYLVNRVINNESCVVLTEKELSKLIAKFPLTKADVQAIYNNFNRLTDDQLTLINKTEEANRALTNQIGAVNREIIKLSENMELKDRIKALETNAMEQKSSNIWIGLTIIALVTAVCAILGMLIMFNQ